MSNIELATGMEIDTEVVDSHLAKVGDHVVIGEMIYRVTDGWPGTKGVPVWSRETDRGVSGREIDLAYATGTYVCEFEVIIVVR